MKSFKYNFSFYIFLFSLSQLSAQNVYNLSGFVLDKVYQQPLDSVSVQILTTADTVNLITSAEGYYTGSIVVTSISEPQLPQKYDLISQNYPNPFNPSTRITYTKPGLFEIFDITGKRVMGKKIKNSDYNFKMNLSSGVYVYCFTAKSGKRAVKKMVLLDGHIAVIRLTYFSTGQTTEVHLNKKAVSELTARYLLEKDGFISIDTSLTLFTDSDNKHDFNIAQENYPPIVSGFPDFNLDQYDSTIVNLNPFVYDVDDDDSQIIWSAHDYDPGNVEVTIDNLLKTAKIKAIGSGEHDITFRGTDPGNLSDEDVSHIFIQYIAMLNALLMAAVTDDILPGITVKVDGTPYVSNAQGIVTLPFRTGQRHLVEVDSNAVTWGWQRAITYNREEDGDLDDILLLDTDADFALYEQTDRTWINNQLFCVNSVWDHPVITYILVNPTSPEFEEAAKQRLMDDHNQLDLKGRQTFSFVQTIHDTITPTHLLDDVYGRGQYADVAVFWKPTGGPAGLNYTEKDTTGRVLWGHATINDMFTSPLDYGYMILKGETFQCFGPSTADANPDSFPQYQLTFYGTALPPPAQIFYNYGNGPNGMVNYRGENIEIEILKATMKLDYRDKYGFGVRWNEGWDGSAWGPRIVIIPDIIIN